MAAAGIKTAVGRLLYVVDDEKLIAEVLQQILESAGYEVKVFSDPVSALNSFSEAPRKPDMVLTDYVMKPMNGMELLQKCRMLHPALLTILFSGNVTDKITDLYAQKPSAFVAKPFQPAALVGLVRQLLPNSDEQRAERP